MVGFGFQKFEITRESSTFGFNRNITFWSTWKVISLKSPLIYLILTPFWTHTWFNISSQFHRDLLFLDFLEIYILLIVFLRNINGGSMNEQILSREGIESIDAKPTPTHYQHKYTTTKKKKEVCAYIHPSIDYLYLEEHILIPTKQTNFTESFCSGSIHTSLSLETMIELPTFKLLYS